MISESDNPAARFLERVLRSRRRGVPPGEYNPEAHGFLAEAELSSAYEELERYWVTEGGLALVVIARNRETNQVEYLLFEPVLSDLEYELLERLFADLRDVLILDDHDPATDRRAVLARKIQDLLAEYGLALPDTSIFRIRYYLERNFLGWSRIDALMRDPGIEDISCDGTKIPLFLYHRKYQNIRTKIRFDEPALNSLAITLAQRSGKHVSIGSPLVDATLPPDGSRLQLAFGNEVTPRGTSFTIRKFRETPFTPVELIESNTFDIDQIVYFWMAIENNKSLLFVGGTASGKTTSLNAVALFIPPLSKIVSIEDTREITLYHENWVASVTRDTVAEGTGTTVIEMFELLKAAMRQRPRVHPGRGGGQGGKRGPDALSGNEHRAHDVLHDARERRRCGNPSPGGERAAQRAEEHAPGARRHIGSGAHPPGARPREKVP